MGTERFSLALDAARRYGVRLRWLKRKPGASLQLRQVIDKLISSLDAAIRLENRLTPDDIPFTSSLVTPLLESGEWQELVNPFSVGYGREDAPLVVMGTEEAYDPKRDLGLWNCAGAVVTLSGSSLPILRKLAFGAPEETVAAFERDRGHGPYHVYPAEYMRDGKKASAASTRLSSVWFNLAGSLGTTVELLGDACYQIERSALPATAAGQGLPPDPDRVTWLADTLPLMPAPVLLLHGSVGPPDEVGSWWGRANNRVTCAFLGASTLPPAARGRTPSEHPVVFSSGHRKAIWATSLSGRNRYLDAAYRLELQRVLHG